VGEHAEAVWKSVKRSPWDVASLCKLGVAISPPKGEVSELQVRLWVAGFVQSEIIGDDDEEIGSGGSCHCGRVRDGFILVAVRWLYMWTWGESVLPMVAKVSPHCAIGPLSLKAARGIYWPSESQCRIAARNR
jgi:hypothetical protein